MTIEVKEKQMTSELDKMVELGVPAIQKCHTGEAISDEELTAGIDLLGTMVAALQQMGERYYLAYSNLHRDLDQLIYFFVQRAHKL